jgi:lysophospholipase L1-like esterase
MFECLILGDSIAVGVKNARPECQGVAVVGINTKTFIGRFGDKRQAKTIIISLGSNDLGNRIDLDLEKYREKLTADRVIWILPSEAKRPREREFVIWVAKRFNDATINIPNDHLEADGIHPTAVGYNALAKQTK